MVVSVNHIRVPSESLTIAVAVPHSALLVGVSLRGLLDVVADATHFAVDHEEVLQRLLASLGRVRASCSTNRTIITPTPASA